MSERRLGIVVLGLVTITALVGMAAVRALVPDAALDTTGFFGLMTLLVIQIARLGSGSDDDA